MQSTLEHHGKDATTNRIKQKWTVKHMVIGWGIFAQSTPQSLKFSIHFRNIFVNEGYRRRLSFNSSILLEEMWAAIRS